MLNEISKPLDDWLVEQFVALDKTPTNDRPPTKKIAIISTPRCGSKLVCGCLNSTSRFGNAAEWMNPLRLQAYGRFLNRDVVDLKTYLDYVTGKTTTDNGVFTLNFHVDQYIFWQQRNFDLFSISFDYVVYLFRRDKLAQAYSYAKALLTGQWRSSMAAQCSPDLAEVTRPMVISALQALVEWQEIFDRQLVSRVQNQYCYEDFISAPSTFAALLGNCGIEVPSDHRFTCEFESQSTALDKQKLNEIRRFLGYSGPA